jgi:HSP20 family molecular chaperone IbpA
MNAIARWESLHGLSSLHDQVNTESIHAEYKNGVLTVNLPKREESKPRQVKVDVNVSSKGQ